MKTIRHVPRTMIFNLLLNDPGAAHVPRSHGHLSHDFPTITDNIQLAPGKAHRISSNLLFVLLGVCTHCHTNFET